MNKRKKFTISNELSQGLTDTVNAVKNNAGDFRFGVIALLRIELDPENPRELKINESDVRGGLNKGDKEYVYKNQELENLQKLANTIKERGVINPVVVYKRGEKYRLLAGERRFLASIIAKREDIQAKILEEKPKPFDTKILQWIENTEREDLSLKDRLNNVKQIIDAYKELNKTEVTATLLKDFINVSLPQATCYLSAFKMPNDLKVHVEAGEINNLDKVALIANIQSVELRNKLIEECLAGKTLKDLRITINQESKAAKQREITKIADKRGRAATRVNMGSTVKTQVAKYLIDCVVEQKKYGNYAKHFSNINWKDYSQATNAFRNLIEILEKTI